MKSLKHVHDTSFCVYSFKQIPCDPYKKQRPFKTKVIYLYHVYYKCYQCTSPLNTKWYIPKFFFTKILHPTSSVSLWCNWGYMRLNFIYMYFNLNINIFSLILELSSQSKLLVSDILFLELPETYCCVWKINIDFYTDRYIQGVSFEVLFPKFSVFS